MINLNDPLHIHRLFESIKASRDALDPFRRNRREMISQYVGSYYSAHGPDHKVMVNLLNQAAGAFTMALAYNCPRVHVTTRYRELIPFALRFEVSLNNFIKQMHIEETNSRIVLDAFFSIGVAKVYQADWAYIQVAEDTWVDPGQPYVARVSIDDFFMDMSVADIRKCAYMGDFYRVPWDKVRNDPYFDQSVVAKLSPTSWNDDGNGTRAQDISSSRFNSDSELQPMLDVQDVWLAGEGLVATFARDVETKPLAVRSCDDEEGPYHILSLADVPDNLMPSAPAQNLYPSHELFNGLFRKQAKQAQRHKVNPIYRPGAEEDAKRLKTVSDGEWVKVNDPSSINTIVQGGIDPANTAFSVSVADWFNRLAGNLEAMLGLGPQAETLGQEQLIQGSVSRQTDRLLNRVDSFMAGVCRHVGQLMWKDELLEIPGSIEAAPGTGIYVDASWRPGHREGNFLAYNFNIEPYSMAYQPPGIKIQKMERIVGMLMQLWPIVQQSGGTIDVQELVRQYVECLDLPELLNVITFAIPPSIERPGPQTSLHGSGPGQGMNPSMPLNTTREYVRRNVSMGGTPAARSADLQQSLLALAQASRGNQQTAGVGVG